MTRPTRTEAARVARLSRIVCAMLGHQPGDQLFRYHYAEPIRTRSQWPGRTYTVGAVGHRCKRCGKDLEA